MNTLRALILACATLLGASSTPAHHSNTMVDLTRTIKISGTVKEWLFANPHCWIYVTVAKPDGSTEEWGVEGGPILSATRLGVRAKTFKVGDKVEVTLSPRRDDKPGGFLHAVKMLDTGKDYSFMPPGTSLPSAEPTPAP